MNILLPLSEQKEEWKMNIPFFVSWAAQWNHKKKKKSSLNNNPRQIFCVIWYLYSNYSLYFCSPHKELIQKITYLEKSNRYLAISKVQYH